MDEDAGDAFAKHEFTEAKLALEHAISRPSWRPVAQAALDTLFRQPATRCMYDLALETYWELYASQPGCHYEPCVVFTAIQLLQRAFMAGVQTRCEDHIAPACLWIAAKVVDGQDACGSSYYFCVEWNRTARSHIYAAELREAEVDVLLTLQFDVTQSTTLDLCVLCLRLARDEPTARKVKALDDMVELLMIVDKLERTLHFTPVQMCLALCTHFGVPVDGSLLRLQPAAAEARAFIQSFQA